MLWVIDPDVLTSAQNHPACQMSLLSILNQLRAHQFAVDNNEIKREYLTFWKAYRNTDHPGITILRQIFDDLSGLSVEVSSDVAEFSDRLAALGVREPVEPSLLAIVARTEVNSPVLLLTGSTAAIRKRQLHDAAICRIARNRWCQWLDVRYAGDTDFQIPSPVRERHADLDSALFEKSAALALQEIDSSLRFRQSPPKGTFGEEIDVFGEKKVKGRWTIVIGECKLREEGNESKQIGTEVVDQVDRKARKVEAYYRAKRKVDNFRIERHIVTNAVGVEPDAKAKASALTKIGYPVYFWQAKLERGWSRKKNWRIMKLSPIE